MYRLPLMKMSKICFVTEEEGNLNLFVVIGTEVFIDIACISGRTRISNLLIHW